MQVAFIDICGMPTRVISWGKPVPDTFTADGPKDIVICIPGNPGVTHLYLDFLKTVYDKLKIPVWIIGHAGHEIPDNPDRKMPPLGGNEKMYGLQGQILYKQAFIEKYVPKDVKIHFIGHSIGAYMVLELLKMPTIHSRAIGSYLLFPVIEDMSQTTSSKRQEKLAVQFAWLIKFLLFCLCLFPTFLQNFLLKISMTLLSNPLTHLEITTASLQPIVAQSSFTLYLDQIATVKQRDDEIIKQNENAIKLYYGSGDDWARSYTKLQRDIPNVDAELGDMPASFMINHSEEMGNIIAGWVKSREG